LGNECPSGCQQAHQLALMHRFGRRRVQGPNLSHGQPGQSLVDVSRPGNAVPRRRPHLLLPRWMPAHTTACRVEVSKRRCRPVRSPGRARLRLVGTADQLALTSGVVGNLPSTHSHQDPSRAVVGSVPWSSVGNCAHTCCVAT
jgi:hypothetical protein